MNPELAATLQDADLAAAAWHLTGLGYNQEDADRILGRMVADGIDYTSGKAMAAWIHANPSLTARN